MHTAFGERLSLFQGAAQTSSAARLSWAGLAFGGLLTSRCDQFFKHTPLNIDFLVV